MKQRLLVLCWVMWAGSGCGDDQANIGADLGAALDAAADLGAAPDSLGLDKGTVDLARSDSTWLDEGSPDQSALDQALPDQAVLDQASPDQVLPDAMPPDQTLADQTVLDQTPPDQMAPDQMTLDQMAPDQMAPDMALPDQMVLDQALPDQAVPATGWARSAGGAASSDFAFGTAVAVDKNGYSYVGGAFSGTLKVGTTTLTSQGGNDIFVVRLDPAGNFLWAISAPGTNLASVIRMAVDSAGDLHLVGDFQGQVTMGAVTLTSKGKQDLLVAKISATGKVARAASFGGTGPEYGKGIALDSAGKTYVTGTFEGTVAFGSHSVTSAGSSDLFLVKLDSAGTASWAVSAGGTQTDGGLAVAVDASGNATVAGKFEGAMTLGGVTLTSLGSSDVLEARFDSAGKPVWAASAGRLQQDEALGIGVDGAGNSVLVGYYQDAATFGSTSLSSPNSTAMVVARLDSKGAFTWAVSASGSGGLMATEIVVDSAGNSLLSGTLANTVTVGGFTLTSKSMSDPLLARLDASGKVTWAAAAPCSLFCWASSVAQDAQGNSFMAGYFLGTATFAGAALTAGGNNDFFVWKRLAQP